MSLQTRPSLLAALAVLLCICPAIAQVGGGFDHRFNLPGQVGRGAGYGYSLASAGDFDGDSHPDLMVSNPLSFSYSTIRGVVKIYSGTSGRLIHLLVGPPDCMSFGGSIAPAGDVNNDGIDDVIVGAPHGNRSHAYVYSGGNGQLLHEWSRGVVHFGQSVAGVGDVNGDGCDDLIVGAIRASSLSESDCGAAFVYSGLNGELLYRFDGKASGGEFGLDVAGAGDLNQDGVPDFLVSTRNGDAGRNAGSCYAYSGADGSQLFEWQGYAQGDRLGCSISITDDLNHDGSPEVILGAQSAGSPGLKSTGAVYVASGKDGSLLQTYFGARRKGLFGAHVDGFSDINGDGVKDIVIASPEADTYRYGAVFIYSGADGSFLNRIDGVESYGEFGQALACLGDLDGDGFNEVAVTYKERLNFNKVGAVDVFDFNPYLKFDHKEVSVLTGGRLSILVTFPPENARRDYKVLASRGLGPTALGVMIPLQYDSLMQSTFQGGYPFHSHSNLQGRLNVLGDAFAEIRFPAGMPSELIGRTFYFAAVISDPLPTLSSAAVSITFIP